MRAVRKAVVLFALIALARYFPVFYYSSMFNDFVQLEVKRVKLGPQLQQSLLLKAQTYFLPVKAEDIQIKENGELLQVKVDYKVPVDFYIFKHELTFHAAGMGLASH